jgi:hypothetical protein
MYEVIFKDLKSDLEIKKTFNSPYLFKKFVKKVTYSKNLKLLSYMCY